jgi:UDP-N-acetylmuramate--alanine ligase
MLAEAMRLKEGIAVAGSHGKTTTTSLVAHVLSSAGLDPTAVIGGRVFAPDRAPSTTRLGAGDLLVAEADESDGSFLRLAPVVAVVTNIDPEHLDHYGSYAALESAFVAFANRVPFWGLSVLCLDHPGVQAIVPRMTRRTTTYGFASQADLVATNLRLESPGTRFEVRRRGERLGEVRLRLPGRHNVLNALAAIAVGTEIQVPDTAIVKALRDFKGVGRRFQNYGELDGKFTLIDDYGHHPAEMQATLDAARGAFPGRRIVLAFQPHRYTRTRDLFEDFVRVLSSVDVLLLAEVYAAGEAPIVAADGRSLARALRLAGKVEPLFVEDIAEMPDAIRRAAQEGDVVITMGAGSIGAVPAQLI